MNAKTAMIAAALLAAAPSSPALVLDLVSWSDKSLDIVQRSWGWFWIEVQQDTPYSQGVPVEGQSNMTLVEFTTAPTQATFGVEWKSFGDAGPTSSKHFTITPEECGLPMFADPVEAWDKFMAKSAAGGFVLAHERVWTVPSADERPVVLLGLGLCALGLYGYGWRRV